MKPRPGSTRFAARITPIALIVCALLGGLAAPRAAHAQADRDYLIGAPAASLSLRGGLSMPTQSSDIYDDMRTFLTVDRGDLLGGSAALDLGFRLSERIDLVASFGYNRSATWSEFRDWEDTDGLPIEQQTVLTRLPAALSVQFYPSARGRSIGRFAYIPNRWAPYVGAGAGVMWHRFTQEGDFLDTVACEEFDNCAIVPGRLQTEGFVPMAQFFGGVDMRITTRLSLTLDARYHWARGEMGRDFEGFDRIDLSGLQTTAGLHIRL